MTRGQPGQADGESIFAQAQGDVREWFGRGRDGGAGCGFAAVGDQGDGCSQQCGQQLVLRRKLAGRLVGEESGDGDADEGVQGVPDQVEGGDLVGEEFDDEERDAGGDYGPSWRAIAVREEAEDGRSGPAGRGRRP